MDLHNLVTNSFQETLQQLRNNCVHDADFSALRTLPPMDLILDIGANRGQSIASIKAVLPNAKIHAFEANPLFFAGLEELQRNYPETLVVHCFGLGSKHGVLPFYIPWVGETPYLEECSTRPDYFEKPWVVEKFSARGAMRLEERIVEIRPGDELSLSPDFVKIDVEGAELDVLTGLRGTLERTKATLLVENSDWHNVTPFLQGLGYAPFRWETEGQKFVPYYGATTNTFYMHQSLASAIT